MRKTLLLLFSVFGFLRVEAQDLNARIQILSPQIQNTNKRVLDVLETSIRDFLNNRKWSNDTFLAHERVDCNFVINITEWDGSSTFKAEAQIQSSRPVYGTNYTTTLLNINDRDFAFNYQEGQALDYSDQTYGNNLSSLLAYYAYIIMGLDYDSYAKLSGTSYYTRAQTVVNNAQNTAFAGWRAFEGMKNRYWLSENLTNKAYNPIREALYDYHRNGLDVMFDNQAKGRKQIAAVLPQLQKIDRQKQGSMINQIFFSAKSNEIVNVVGQLSPQEKAKSYSILTTLDPANVSKYDILKK